jgi:hypothetical protein
MLRRGAATGAAVLSAAYAYDTIFCYERVNRNGRALFAAAQTVYDYKVNQGSSLKRRPQFLRQVRRRTRCRGSKRPLKQS